MDAVEFALTEMWAMDPELSSIDEAVARCKTKAAEVVHELKESLVDDIAKAFTPNGVGIEMATDIARRALKLED